MAVSMVVVSECFFLPWLGSGTNPTTTDNVFATAVVMVVVPVASITATSTTTTQYKYGQVWLIRHGEKDPLVHMQIFRGGDRSYPAEKQQEYVQELQLQTMYDLNAQGWDRAHHLSSLVKNGK